jgi:hypothetical protein
MSKYTFDRQKLQAEIKAFEANPDSEESLRWLSEEYEHCKDPRYFFNAYWMVDGKHVNPKSEEEWDEMERQREEWLPMVGFKRRR